MAYQIEVQNQGEPPYPVDFSRLEEAAATVLAQHDVHSDTSLSVVIADDDFVSGLNQQFRGIDAPTDVLSFPADEPPVDLDDEPPYLGDLIIAFPYASAQAAR